MTQQPTGEFWGYYPDAKPIRSFYEGDATCCYCSLPGIPVRTTPC